MKRGRIIATCISVAVAGALLATFALQNRGPLNRGRTVNSWLRQVFDPSRSQGEALQALREMGAQAVPFEIRALTRSDSALSRWYQGVYRKLPFRKYLPEPVAAETIRSAAKSDRRIYLGKAR